MLLTSGLPGFLNPDNCEFADGKTSGDTCYSFFESLFHGPHSEAKPSTAPETILQMNTASSLPVDGHDMSKARYS